MRKISGYLRYLRTRMVRDKLPPGRVAAGWAIGMFCGCAIPFGFQLLVSVPVAIWTRTSKIGATLATFITNPFTVFFIYPVQTWVVYRALFGTNPKLPEEWTWNAINGLGWKVLLAYFLGGFVLAAILTPVTYFAVRRTVIVSRAAGEKIRMARERMKLRAASRRKLRDIP